MSIIVHDFAVVGPIPAQNISLAKGLAAERARQVLEDPESPYHLSKICDCREREREASIAREIAEADEAKRLDDETEEGFAALARAALAEVEAPAAVVATSANHDEADYGEVVDDDQEEGVEHVAVVVQTDEDSMDVDSEPVPCVNGHINGHINGHTNGHANGHANGLINGKGVGARLTNGFH